MSIDSTEALNDAQIAQLFIDTDAIRNGHFRLTSGRHSDTYIQCARVMEHPRVTRQLAAETVRRLPDAIRERVTLVASPAIGGMLFGFAVADVLGTSMLFSERVDGVMTLRRAFEIPAGSQVLVAEDVITTGGSVQEVIDLVKASQAEVIAVVSLVDRGGDRVFSEPFFPLMVKETPSWDPDRCEFCRRGVLLDSPGSRNLNRV